MTPFIISLCAFGATMLGGLLALRLRDRLHLVLGFSAGAVIAVAFFDLMPEALHIGGSTFGDTNIIATVAAGFLVYLLLDRILMMHSHTGDDHEEAHARGHVRAGSLSLHSLLDGVGIGLAFQVNLSVGLIVSAAVLAHDFSDGINTVNVVVRHGGSFKKALQWLVVDALAPVLGVTLAVLVFPAMTDKLGLLLALFGGFFLYIGASDLIPESHHAHPTFYTTFMTLVGALSMFVLIKLAGY